MKLHELTLEQVSRVEDHLHPLASPSPTTSADVLIPSTTKRCLHGLEALGAAAFPSRELVL